jgi:LCP family protein required for cell wall assembly
MKIPRRLPYILGGAVLLIAAAVLVIINLPLAPALDVSSAPATRASASAPAKAATATPATAPAATPALPPTPTTASSADPTAAPAGTATSSATPIASTASAQTARSRVICGRRGTLHVLIVGESAPDSASPRGADAIWMVRLDYDAPSMRALALPPDLWVRTPQLAEAEIESTTLMLTYYEALQRAEGSDRARMAAATNVLAKVLADQLGLVADHYISIQPDALPNVIDALGGLSVDLPEEVDGTPDGLGVFQAGSQVLAGEQVLEYVRIYRTAGDSDPTEWERLARQKQILDALQEQLTRPEVIIRLPGLLRHFYADVVTDLTLGDTFTMACLARHDEVSVETLAIGPELVEPVEGQGLVPQMEELSAFLAAEWTR